MVITGEAEKEYWSLLRGNQGKHREFKNKQGRYVAGFNDALHLTLPIVYTFLLCVFGCSKKGGTYINYTSLCRGGWHGRGGKHARSRDNGSRDRRNKAQKVDAA